MPSLVVLIRVLRPYVFLVGILLWLGYRLQRAVTSTTWMDDPTILDGLLALIDLVKTKIWDKVIELNPPLVSSLSTLIDFTIHIVHDVFGILSLVGSLRLLYCLYHVKFSEYRAHIEDYTFEWLKYNVFAVSEWVRTEGEKMTPGYEEAIGTTPFRKDKILALPAKGRNPLTIFEELSRSATKENEEWKSGKISGTVYVADDKHIQLMNDVYGLYSVANILHPGIWPRLQQCEGELVAMTSTMLNGTGIGCTTSGGTESIMLAIKAYWQHYGRRRGIAHPEIICGSTAHAALDKACELYGIRKVEIDCHDGTNNYTLCPKKVERHITSNTILIYASAPCYPQGTVDPVEELGMVAQQYDIGLHVDACLGGFVLAFAPEKFAVFDFRVPGVTSMSADTHKFGYAPKGTSVVLYREKALRHAQYFCYSRWTGGMYGTPTFAGSRPSALVGCAWAALVAIGQEGYRGFSLQVINASQAIADGIREKIPELYILGNQNPSVVVCFGSEEVDVYRVADVMKAKGWLLNSLQRPASVHVCVTLKFATKAEAFVNDLKLSVAEVRAEDPENLKKGTAGIYGMAGSAPEGPVNDLMKVYLDVTLTA